MRLFLYLLILFGASNSLAKIDHRPPIVLQKAPCFAKLKSDLSKVRSAGVWEEIRPLKQKAVYRVPLQEIGHWMQVSLSNSNTLRVQKISPKKLIFRQFGKNCSSKTHAKANPLWTNLADLRKRREPSFTDSQLKKIIAKGKGIIYLWDPGFVLSWQKMNEAQRAAQRNGLEFNALVNLNSSVRWLASKDLARIPKKYKSKNVSMELEMRDPGIHAPTMFFYKDGIISNEILTGVYTTDILSTQIKRILK